MAVSGQNDLPLAQAVNEAELLLAYAASNGISLADEVMGTLINARQVLRQEAPDCGLSVEQRVAFWRAFSILAAAVHPVTPASIEASLSRSGRHGPWGRVLDRLFGPKLSTHAERSIYRFSLISFCILILLLAVQMYWVIGSRLEAQSGQLIEQAESIGERMRQLGKSERSDDAFELQALEAALDELNLELSIRVEALDHWNGIWRALLPGINPSAPNAEQATPFVTLRKARLEASLAKECIELYLLPLLYGLLGSCLHVLRTLVAAIESRTHVVNRLYQIRIYTGGLAGLVVAWFGIGSGMSGPLSSLTPFALAFLAGYSVELLFAFMDRLVSAFSGQQPGARERGISS